MKVERRQYQMSVGAFDAVDGASLAVFRIGFGAVMALWAAVELLQGRVATYYLKPAYLFKYPGFEWVAAPPAAGLYSIFVLMCLTALMIAAGAVYRLAAVLFCLAFTYFFC